MKSIKEFAEELEVYTRFKAIAEQSPISNRYSYLYKMICTDREKQRGESQ